MEDSTIVKLGIGTCLTLWLAGSLFLLGGFSRMTYLNNHSYLGLGIVIKMFNLNSIVTLNVTYDYGKIIMSNITIDKIDATWYVGSYHAVFIDHNLNVTLYPSFEYWSLILAGLLFLTCLIILIAFAVFRMYMAYKRRLYKAVNGEVKDYIIISSKDLDSRMV